MSLPWRDEVGAFLGPRRVRLVRSTRGLVRHAAGEATQAIDNPKYGTWSQQVTALATRLGEADWRGSDVFVVVSDYWARYAVIRAHDALDDAEREAQARGLLAERCGHGLEDWTVILSPERNGRQAVAALPAALLRAVRNAVESAGSRLVSVQPHLAVAFDLAGAALPPAGGWFATVDDGTLAMARAAEGAWLGAQSVRTTGDWGREVQRLRASGWDAAGLADGTAILVDAPMRLRDSRPARGMDVDWVQPAAGAGSTLRRLLSLRIEESPA